MNVTTTVKDKEVQIPRWQPLQRLPRFPKLSPKRLIILIVILGVLMLFFSPSYMNRSAIDPDENDEDVVKGLRKELKATMSLRGEFSLGKAAAIFVTGHDVRDAAGITALACDMAAAKKLNVLILYVGVNATETVPFFFRANGFDRTSCPVVWHDARHRYSSVNKQESATEQILADAIGFIDPSVAVYVEDEEDWIMQVLERVVYWRQPAISLIQLKRAALPNLRWISTLTPSALAAWNIPQIDVAITTSQENTGTLYRLIESLLSAEYIQPVLPRLFITFNPNTTTPAILKLLKKWPSDRLILRHQIAPPHTSFPDILQSWYPSDDDNYVLALQDDVELSPWYMYWLHLSLMRYVYSEPPTEFSSTSMLVGISLQSASRSSRSGDARTLDIRRALLLAPMYAGWQSYSTPYIYQQTLFHSTLFFPLQWREFHNYIAMREYFGGGIDDFTTHVSTFQSGEPLALEVYWLELLIARGYAILYPNFEDDASFAIQHFQPEERPSEETPLLQWGQLFDEIKDGLPDWEDLPVLDYERRVIGWDGLERASRKVLERLSSCKDIPEYGWQVRDLFCYPEEDAYRHRDAAQKSVNIAD